MHRKDRMLIYGVGSFAMRDSDGRQCECCLFISWVIRPRESRIARCCTRLSQLASLL